MLINRQPENNRDNFLPSVSLPSLGLAVSLVLQQYTNCSLGLLLAGVPGVPSYFF